MPTGWHSWFVTGHLHLRLRFQQQPMSVDFHDQKIDSGHERPCGQESTLEIPYAVLFQLQACSPPDELYAVGHYHPENKGISNGSSVRDDMRSKSISSAYLRPVKVPFRMICRSVRPPMLIPPHTIQPALLYCDLHGRMRVILSAPCLSIQEHIGCHILD
ncbi:hypothetical protein TNCV_1945421 [Trichonephila clavipes]|nr:hypothetical protein TNCV_1945421 [Trichonephila clavipes]